VHYRECDFCLGADTRTNQLEDALKGTERLSNGISKLYMQSVLKVVLDRMTEGVDIATRTDVTTRQVRDALHLLHDIRSRADWPIEFSRSEIAVIAHGVRQDMLDQPMSAACVRGGIRAGALSGISGVAEFSATIQSSSIRNRARTGA
jgi:hypothetical protein